MKRRCFFVHFRDRQAAPNAHVPYIVKNSLPTEAGATCVRTTAVVALLSKCSSRVAKRIVVEKHARAWSAAQRGAATHGAPLLT